MRPRARARASGRGPALGGDARAVGRAHEIDNLLSDFRQIKGLAEREFEPYYGAGFP
jgi:hypothetical protein